MRRPARINRYVLGALALPGLAAAWGCAEAASEDKPTTTSGAGGSGGIISVGGSGGINVGAGGGGGGVVCTLTTKKAAPVPLDLVVVLDWSQSMQGNKWTGTTSALSEFFNDPASAGISVGMVYFPSVKPFAIACDAVSYTLLDVPIAPLPGNAFDLTNSMPAIPNGASTPTFGGLKGAAQAACAYQDAHPTHKVNIVLATDGDPTFCANVTIDKIAGVAKDAQDYNGVRTYVIGVEGSTIYNLDKIAAAGGTTKAYDITQDISQFSAAMAEIRSAALSCEFGIPPPPQGEELIPDEVNFTYTPGGTGTPVTLPRADDLADCGDKPGWYFDNNAAPKKIILCPASCNTVQNDQHAEVSVAFGCHSELN